MSALGARKAPARDGLDRYYTPQLCADACVSWLPDSWGSTAAFEEPSFGGGAFVRALRGRWPSVPVTGFDLDPDADSTGLQWAITGDYLATGAVMQPGITVVGNPEYRNAEAHVRHALARAPRVAMLLRLAFAETKKRAPFWEEWPAAAVHVLAERPSFTGNGTDGCAYGLFVWSRDHVGPAVFHAARSWK